MSEAEVEVGGQSPESSAQEPAKVKEETKENEVNEEVKADTQEELKTEDTNGGHEVGETLATLKGMTNGDETVQEPSTEANGVEGDETGDKNDDERSVETEAKEDHTNGDNDAEQPTVETIAKGDDTNGNQETGQPSVETSTKEVDANGDKTDQQPSVVANPEDDDTAGDKKDEESLKESNVAKDDKANCQQADVDQVNTEKKQPESEDKKDGDAKKREYFRDKINRRKDNIKYDASSLEISSDPDEIRKQASASFLVILYQERQLTGSLQVEFYFSDSNLPMDRFLLERVGGTSNHPVDIKMIHNFKRMRHFQPYSAVVAALKESQILEVTEGDKVKRKVPLPAEALGADVKEGRKIWEDKTIPRSIYAVRYISLIFLATSIHTNINQKGFDAETPTTQFDIEAFFAPYGPTNAIRLRRTLDNIFKGSVFVEFADEATQQAFLALEPKPKWKGKDLLIKSKKDYVDGKAADIEAGRIKPKPNPRYNNNNNRKDGDQTDWKKRREEDQKKGFRDNQGHRGRGNDNRGRGGHWHDNGRGRGRGRGRGGRGRGDFRERDPQ